MDSDIELYDPNNANQLNSDPELTTSTSSLVKNKLPPLQHRIKIVAVESLAGNENLTQNFLSEMNDELKSSLPIRPKLKIVPIASLKSPVAVKTIANKSNDGTTTNDLDGDDDDDHEVNQIKRFRIDKLASDKSIEERKVAKLPMKIIQPQIERRLPVFEEIEMDSRPSGSSRRKSRITPRNAEFDEPSLLNNVVVNALREEQLQRAREMAQGSSTELELMRNVAFLRVCVNHILTKIGKRPISYDRNNQTLASLIHKYSKS